MWRCALFIYLKLGTRSFNIMCTRKGSEFLWENAGRDLLSNDSGASVVREGC